MGPPLRAPALETDLALISAVPQASGIQSLSLSLPICKVELKQSPWQGGSRMQWGSGGVELAVSGAWHQRRHQHQHLISITTIIKGMLRASSGLVSILLWWWRLACFG